MLIWREHLRVEIMCVTTEASQELLEKTRNAYHARCTVCGTSGSGNPGLRFMVQGDCSVECLFDSREHWQGYAGCLHGGIVAMLLDSAMVNCLFALGKVALTGELKVRFRKRVIVGSQVVVRGWTVESLSPLFCMAASIRQNDEIMATGSAKFMEMESG